ncbi:MAG TPA: hypothetical protein VF529_05585 [Solirubrobacteraceae bacterium]|jgi:hypothetical protein
MTKRAVASVAVLVALAAAAPAEAAKVFEGTTGQSRRITLRVGDDGRIQRIVVRWTAPCARRGTVLSDTTFIRPARRLTTPQAFRSSGGYRYRARGGWQMRVRMRMRGTLEEGSDGSQVWSGTFRVSVAVRRRGRPYGHCRLPATLWSAVPPVVATDEPQTSPPPSDPTPPPPLPPGTWRFEMTGDPDDYITGGRSWVHEPPSDTLSGTGGNGGVSFRIDTSDGGSWHADFRPPPGQRFEVGKTYEDARHYPSNGDHPGLAIGGMGRGCRELTGRFTVHELGIDDQGRLTRARISFEQHCENGPPAARGTFDYTAS